VSTDDPTLNFITPRVAAGVLFTDDQGRVLMVVPSYKDYLDIPGGYVEHGETPYRAAQREVYEELGVKPPIGNLLVADWREDSPEANGEAKLLLIFDGGRLDDEQVGRLSPDQAEVIEYRFVDTDDLDELTISRLARRIRAAVAAKAESSIAYLENGAEMAPGTRHAGGR
jgi:8-oxo-dGTP pyrophosphatase MutT (NUDIX family)